MIRLTLDILIMLLIAVGCCTAEFRQERAKMTYFNPKYITNVVVITRRVSRHEPYRTNLTGTILVPFGNNVTFAIILQLKNGGDFRLHAKACDTLKNKWMNKYMVQFSNLTLDRCPFLPGRYAYINMELPPKNVPLPVMDGDYYITMELSVTGTKEKILVVTTMLHFDDSVSSKKSDDKNEDSKTKDKNKNKKG